MCLHLHTTTGCFASLLPFLIMDPLPECTYLQKVNFERPALTVNVGFKGTSWSEDDFNSRWFPEYKCGQTPSDYWGSLQSAGECTLEK